MREKSAGSRDHLSAERRALLEKRLQGKPVEPETTPASRDPAVPVPLTPLQTQLWALAQSHPRIAAYNMHRAIRFTGGLEIAALRRAISTVVERHEALRTIFGMRDQAIVQMVPPGLEFELQVDKSDDTARRAEAELRKPFDLAAGPLIRFLLLEESKNQHLFLIVVHHIVADEWSLDICLRELNSAYNGEKINAEKPLQYGDYVLQKLADINRKSRAHVDFWRERLVDVDHSIQLPFDYPRPRMRAFEGDLFRTALNKELVGRLLAMAARQNVTPFVLLYAAFNVLLARLSGQSRFATGVPSANRVGGRAETAIGLFVGSLPLACHIDRDETFSEYLKASRRNFLDALMHQDFSFDELLSAIGCERDPSRNPVFQTMFVLETDSLEKLVWSGVSAERVELNGGGSKFDLTLFVDPGSQAPSVAVEFNTAIFEAATAEQILAAYVRVLEQIDQNPDVPLGQIDILPEQMRRRLLTEFGAGTAGQISDIRQESTLPQQILQMADLTPDAVAVVFDGQSLTYSELVAEAGGLATQLREAGVCATDLVGVFVERSIEQIIAILGVQFAGAAYVPVDPDYPAERLDIIFNDLAESNGSATPHVVTSAALAGRLRDDVSQIVIHASTSASSARPSRLDIDPGSPAYVIYTSGSTGRPKGVIVSHASLIASTAARRQYYDLPERYLLIPSFAFDSSVAGIFWTLSCGGMLVIPSPSDSRDPVALGKIIASARISHTLMLPTLRQWILRHYSGKDFGRLDTVIVAGEVCSKELVDFHHSVTPDVRLFNEYGPTETTVWVSVQRCDAGTGSKGTVPIGQPIAGARTYVLDTSMNLVPIGVTGELYVGGDGVAKGYLGRHEETAARFLPDPFLAGNVVYRTGDLVRWRQDGALEYVGRVDNQLKLRGYRIEPAEIEAQIAAHPDVDESGVAIVADTADDLDDIEQAIALAERLPATLVENLLTQVENSETPS